VGSAMALSQPPSMRLGQTPGLRREPQGLTPLPRQQVSRQQVPRQQVLLQRQRLRCVAGASSSGSHQAKGGVRSEATARGHVASHAGGQLAAGGRIEPTRRTLRVLLPAPHVATTASEAVVLEGGGIAPGPGRGEGGGRGRGRGEGGAGGRGAPGPHRGSACSHGQRVERPSSR